MTKTAISKAITMSSGSETAAFQSFGNLGFGFVSNFDI
jgi:hypothetical protein